MKFTCLNKGDGFHFSPCHMLNVSGFRILLDCPLDLSSLAIFSSVPVAHQAHESLDTDSVKKKQKTEKALDANDLVHAEPWYKTVKNLHLWDASFIDVVLISSPMGMLGLPFLTRTKDFSAKIYVTEATARIGELLMEDLISMHMELRQFYGPEDSCFPQWMRWEELEVLPPELRKISLGKDCEEMGAWMPLYSDDVYNLEEMAASLLKDDESMEEAEKLAFICTCALDSVRAGGSVLLPIGRLGIFLCLLEQMSLLLESLSLEVPIYIISSIAEELLAFTNIIPEWLCKQRQQKLFSGEPLFAHVKLIKERKIQVFPAVHSPELLTNWQEPCIVFCPHWSLRLGPVVHLLRYWCSDPNSLLVLESGVDADIALLPFRPMAMKVLQCSFLSGIRLQKVQPLLKTLQPKIVLFPKDLRCKIQISEPNTMFLFSENETLRIPSSKESTDVDIATDLASKFQWKTLKQGTVTRLDGELFMYHGKHRLLSGVQPARSKQQRPLVHWGSPDLKRLLTELSKMGINGTIKQVSDDAKSENAGGIIDIHDPDKALIDVRETGTVIIAADENLASQIVKAVDIVLDGI
ncbi:hypothetical protein PTKIN_Ptkin16aG0015800 [Pterospermum kingtungense]